MSQMNDCPRQNPAYRPTSAHYFDEVGKEWGYTAPAARRPRRINFVITPLFTISIIQAGFRPLSLMRVCINNHRQHDDVNKLLEKPP